jgi:hypothetical protein
MSEFFKTISKGIEMKTAMVVSLAFIGYLAMLGSLRAADSCSKECSNFQKACLQAHSKAACQTDYNICIKHCQAR